LPVVAPSTQYPVVISSFVFNKVVILLLVSRRSIETPYTGVVLRIVAYLLGGQD
jgi:hypothetical protein